MSKVLRKALINRQVFDPSNPQHVRSLKVFIRTGNWGEVQFYPELPYEDVPTTVLMKFASSMLEVERETEAERADRLAALNLPQALPQSREARVKERDERIRSANELMTVALQKLSPVPAKLEGPATAFVMADASELAR